MRVWMHFDFSSGWKAHSPLVFNSKAWLVHSHLLRSHEHLPWISSCLQSDAEITLWPDCVAACGVCQPYPREHNRSSRPSGAQCSIPGLRGKELHPLYVVPCKDGAKVQSRWHEKQLNLYLSVPRVFTAAEGPRARDLCARSLALLEAPAVLHQREQRHRCAQSSWLAHPTPSESVEPFFRNGSATWLGYCAWIWDQTNKRKTRPSARGRHTPS